MPILSILSIFAETCYWAQRHCAAFWCWKLVVLKRDLNYIPPRPSPDGAISARPHVISFIPFLPSSASFRDGDDDGLYSSQCVTIVLLV